MKKAVIFDMDGVLILTEEVHFKFLSQALSKHRLSLLKQDYLELFIGRKIKDGIISFLEKYEVDQGLAEKIISDFKTAKEKSFFSQNKLNFPLRKFTKELLGGLKAKGYMLAIATSTRREFADPTVKGHDIEKYFDVIVAGDEASKGKPDPEIYLKTAEKLGCVSEECVVIEDTPQGIRSAKSAGMKCIAIKNDDFELDLSRADEVVGSFEELEEKL